MHGVDPRPQAAAASPGPILRSIRFTYAGFNSTPTHLLPRSWAAISVVPEPAYGSSTTSPGRLVIATHRRASFIGIIAG